VAGTVVASTTTISDRDWTIRDLEQLPPGSRYELLDGVLYMAALPVWPHGGIAGNLAELLGPWVRTRRLGRVVGAQTGISLGERNYVDPDVMYLRPEQLPAPGSRPVTATIAVEVMSPSNFRAPREDRERLFQRAGVPEIWYVSYETRSIEIRRLQGSAYVTTSRFGDEDLVTSQELPDLSFPLAQLWEDLGAE
jgi:Uma2 family endonuclease